MNHQNFYSMKKLGTPISDWLDQYGDPKIR